jgi:hypothetical protein
LDPDASKFCTIIFPWGKYTYHCKFSRHISSKNVRVNGIPRVCKILD